MNARQLDVPSAALARGLVSRRTLMAGAGALGVAATAAACGTKGTDTTTAPSDQAAAQDRSDTDKTVVWSSWPEYIDTDDKTQDHPTIDQFEKRTGITITYTEDQNDNEEWFAMVKPALQHGPVKGAKKELMKSDPAVASNPLIFPGAEVMGRAHVFMGLSAGQETRYNQAFQAAITG